MGLLDMLFGSDDESEDKDKDDDEDGLFTNIFGNSGEDNKDDDLASGDYKEKDWYD